MYRRFTPASYVVFILIAIGIFSSFLADPRGMIIPIAVFGLVLFFLKFPPKRLSARNRYYPNRFSAPVNKKKHRQVKFHVIRGNKSDESEEPPKYH